MSVTTTVELPDISALTVEQKKRLLALLVKDELDSQPIPMPIIVRLDDKEIGQFRPKITPPEKTSVPVVPEGYWDEIAMYAQNPGRTFTEEEILALEESGDAEWLPRR